MNITIARIAQQEFDDAREFYEIEQSGIGTRFAEEIRRYLLRIQQYPLAGPIERGEIRHYLVHKFPYKILYSVQGEHIVILAFAHQHRQHDYWIERLK